MIRFPTRPPAARIDVNASQSVPNLTVAGLTLGSVRYDPDGLVSGSTIVIKRKGVYLLSAGAFWDQNTAGTRILWVVVNGTNSDVDSRDANLQNVQSATNRVNFPWFCNAGDVIAANVYQGSGGALNVLGLVAGVPYSYLAASLMREM